MPKIVKLEDGTEINVWMSDEVTAEITREKEKARSEEKDKLYPEIQNLKNLSNGYKAQMEEKAKELEDLKNKGTESGSQEYKLLVDEMNKIKTDFEAKAKELESQNQNLTNSLNQESLGRYKAEKLREAGQEIIVEMVVGATKEEIDVKIEEAKEAYKKYAPKPAEQKDEPKEKEKEAEKDGLPPKTKDVPESGQDVLTAEDIKNMSPAEYLKNREQIRKIMKQNLNQ